MMGRRAIRENFAEEDHVAPFRGRMARFKPRKRSPGKKAFRRRERHVVKQEMKALDLSEVDDTAQMVAFPVSAPRTAFVMPVAYRVVDEHGEMTHGPFDTIEEAWEAAGSAAVDTDAQFPDGEWRSWCGHPGCCPPDEDE